MKSPLSVVKERFGDKDKLVAAVQKLATNELWLDRTNEAKGLQSVSNTKLLRLHDALQAAKKEFGSRDKLVGAILELESRTKDEGYKVRLNQYAIPRLLDAHGAAAKRSKRAAASAAPAPKAKKVARSKKAQAKAAQK